MSTALRKHRPGDPYTRFFCEKIVPAITDRGDNPLVIADPRTFDFLIQQQDETPIELLLRFIERSKNDLVTMILFPACEGWIPLHHKKQKPYVPPAHRSAKVH